MGSTGRRKGKETSLQNFLNRLSF